MPALFGSTGQTPMDADAIKQKRQLAQLMMMRAMQPQAVNENTSPLAAILAPFASTIAAKRFQNQATEGQQAMEQRRSDDMAKILAAAQGTPEQRTMVAMNDDEGNAMPAGGPMREQVTPAVPGSRDALVKAMLGAKSPDIQNAGMQALVGGKIGANSPMSVQEWQFYSALPKDQQSQYLLMKRQGYNIHEIGGVPTMAPSIPGLPVVPLSNLPREINAAAGKAGAVKSAQTAGEEQTKAALDLPKMKSQMDTTLANIEALRTHPGRDYSTGAWSLLPDKAFAGTSRAGFVARYNQLKGTNFLQAYNTLKGGGQITEVEGKKAEEAMARMDRSQNKEDFDAALNDFSDAVRTGYAKLAERAGTPTATPSAASTNPAIDDLLKKY